MPDKGSNIIPLHPRRVPITRRPVDQKRSEQVHIYRLPDGSLIRVTLRRD